MLNTKTASKDDHLRFRFAHCLGLTVFDSSVPISDGAWHFDFKLTKIHKTASTGDNQLNELNVAMSLMFWLFLSASVTLEGCLVDSSSGRTLSKKKLSNSITPTNFRSHHGSPTLPLIEHGALRLLSVLEKQALKTLANTAS
ncbi:MAG: hypothetical protein AAGA50_22565 [Pseudomonadota bacterium]